MIPTDFSEGSRKAYAYAESLLRVFGGQVDMIFVIPTVKYLHESMKKMGYPFSLDHDVYPHIMEDTEDMLKAEMQEYLAEPFRGESVVRIGRKAYEVILEHAYKEQYDLILMGAQGRHAGKVTRGHVTEKVIRHSEIPVLSVSGNGLPEGMQNILVPTDFSDLSFRALLPASIFAGRLKSGIILFHVVELHGSEPEESDQEAATFDQYRKKIAEKVRDFLSRKPKARMRLEDSGRSGLLLCLDRDDETYEIPVQLAHTRGISAHYEIVDYAEEHADMIVLATHGRSGLSQFFMGSTTEKVVQAARIPVLTTRPREMIRRPEPA